jgi:urea carboxylase-associated protein 2
MSTEGLNTEQTPEEYRQRYLELKTRAAEANAKRPTHSLTENPRQIPAASIISEERIPPGWYWPARVPRGTTLRLLNDYATHGVSVLLWNAHDTSERYNPADTVKLQWTVRLGRGNLLFSDMGRVLASITDDTCGMHDSLAGGSTKGSNARKYSHATLRNTRDNFLLAAAKLGLGPRDVGPCITFFAPLVTDSEGHFVWEDDTLNEGDYVDLRAEMDLLVAISNCPHPLSPGANWQAHPVRAILWESPPPDAPDFCRTSSDEAVRGFENTDALIGSRAIP